MEFAHQKHRDQNGGNNDDTTHGGHTDFLGVIRINGLVALSLNDFLPFQHLNEPVAEPDGHH